MSALGLRSVIITWEADGVRHDLFLESERVLMARLVL